jgi:NUMOD3 motif
MAANHFYTYIYRDPETYIAKYVGMGSGDRYNYHWKYGARNSEFNSFLVELKNRNTLPVITSHLGLTKDEAKAEEIALIAAIGRLDIGTGTLYNKTIGGESLAGITRTKEWNANISAGKMGYKFSDESKERMSRAQIGKKQTKEHCEAKSKALKGRIVSEETRRKISLSHKGITASTEARAKMSLAKKGRPLSDAHKAAIRDSKNVSK